MRLKEFSKLCGITKNAVMKAIDDGRISSFTKDKQGYLFDSERAFQEYIDNTQSNLSNNKIFSDIDDEDPEKSDEKSVLDIEPKHWTVHQAVQAKTIYQALKVKHELDVEQDLYYLKKEADSEILKITNTFARGLLTLPTRLKQKHPELPDEIFNDLKNLCKDLTKETESAL